MVLVLGCRDSKEHGCTVRMLEQGRDQGCRRVEMGRKLVDVKDERIQAGTQQGNADEGGQGSQEDSKGLRMGDQLLGRE